MNKAQRLTAQEEQEVFQALGLEAQASKTHNELNIDDKIDAELAKLTQHKKNLFLHDAAKGTVLSAVLKAIKAGANVNAEERGYPNYASLEMAISSGKSAPIIFNLWLAGGVTKHQIKTKSIIDAMGNKEQIQTYDNSVEAFGKTWSLIIDRCPCDVVAELIDLVKNQSIPKDAEQAKIIMNIKDSCLKKEELLNHYALKGNWVEARTAVEKFGGILGQKEWEQCFGMSTLRWTFARDQHSERRESICKVIEKIAEQMPEKSAQGLYALAIQNDALDLMTTLLKLRIRPNEQWTVDSTNNGYYYAGKTPPKMENILLVAQRFESSRCTQVLLQIPTIIEKLKQSPVDPDTIAQLKVSEMQKVEQMGVDLSVTDENGNNFLHLYAKKTTDAVAGWPTLARWHPDLLNAKNNDGLNAIDIVRERIKGGERALIGWGNSADKVLEAFEKTVSRAEATVLRKEVAELKIKKASKKQQVEKMRRL